MIGLLLGAAVLTAVGFSAWRWLRRARVARRMRALPGGSAATAIVVTSFDQIDAEIRRRRCPCGGRNDAHGEGTKAEGGRSLRVVRLECRFCERRAALYFDVSRLFH